MHIETVVVHDKLTGKELFEKNGKSILANEDESTWKMNSLRYSY